MFDAIMSSYDRHFMHQRFRQSKASTIEVFVEADRFIQRLVKVVVAEPEPETGTENCSRNVTRMESEWNQKLESETRTGKEPQTGTGNWNRYETRNRNRNGTGNWNGIRRATEPEPGTERCPGRVEASSYDRHLLQEGYRHPDEGVVVLLVQPARLVQRPIQVVIVPCRP